MDEIQRFLIAFAATPVCAARLAEIEMVLAADTAQPGHLALRLVEGSVATFVHP
jgi:hypothetical protein